MASRKVVNIGAQQFDRLIEENKFYQRMVGNWRGRDTDYAPAPFWKDAQHEHGRVFFLKPVRRQK